MQIILARHGETDWNLQGRCQGVTDLNLNANGVRQAEELAACLRGERIAALYSSDLRRAIQTAGAIGRAHRLEVITDRDFRELDHGELEGLTFPQVRSSYPDFIRRWRSDPAELLIPGGERLADVKQRAWRGLERIVHSHSSTETLVVVSHQFPIQAVLCHITGTPLNRYRLFRTEPCSFHRLHYRRGEGWRAAPMPGPASPDSRGADGDL